METTMEEKKWFESKTVWFNTISTILAILSLADIQAFVPAKYIALINAVGNVVLRMWFTSTTLTK